MVNYPYLPSNRDVKFVPLDNPFMAEAKAFCKEHTTDRNHPTGAVIVKDGAIIGRAANQSGYKSKILIEWHKKWMCFRKWFKIKSGEKYWICPGCSTSKQHAESGAVREALKNTKDISGVDLYLWGHWWCCKPCWDAMINAGIKDVYLLENSSELFDKNNSKNIIGKF